MSHKPHAARAAILVGALALAGCTTEWDMRIEQRRAEARSAEAAARLEAAREHAETERLWLERDPEGFSAWALERQLERRRAACREKARVCGDGDEAWCVDRRMRALQVCEALEAVVQ